MKIVLAGDGSVGKTSLRNSYLGRTFKSKYEMTIGADFALHQAEIAGRSVKFQIWDLAGQPRFKDVRSLYYMGCVGALLLFDVTNRDSFQSLEHWINELWEHNTKGVIPFILLGNKVDLRDQFPQSVSDEEAHQYSHKLSELTKSHGFEIEFLHTSAKTGLNVAEAFESLAQTRFKQLEKLRKK